MNCTPELVFVCKLFICSYSFSSGVRGSERELEGYVVEGKFHLESVYFKFNCRMLIHVCWILIRVPHFLQFMMAMEVGSTKGFS